MVANLKVLVAYLSKTGNTKKVAEAIYGAIPDPKEIKRIEDVKSLDGYDLSFLGFPTHQFGPDKQVKALLGKLVEGRTIALFVTHMAPEDATELPGWMQKFRDAAVGANVVGFFDCQGQASGLIKAFMGIILFFRRLPDTSQGKPDEASLEKARTFANDMTSAHATTPLQ